ncbi:MAG TPA: Flp pilus assembly protein CpaB [Acidimicrobiales bacterium]|nr:Flp pilus assembly protein CpaB [Acidimicrobiales bacterium]
MRTRRRLTVRRRLLPPRLRYHPATRWIALAALLALAFAVLHRTSASAADERRQWGATRTVAVARHHIAMGSTIDAGDIESRSWPLAMIPDGAVESVLAGRTATATIEAGEAVLATRLAPDGVHGMAALVPTGWRALAVPVAPTVLTLAVGDHVDLIAGFDIGNATSDRSPTLVVARDAVVVAVDEQRVTVAVPDNDAERVAFAIVSGTVVPALRTSGSR